MMYEEPHNQKGGRAPFLPAAIFAAAVILAGAWIYTTGVKNQPALIGKQIAVAPQGEHAMNGAQAVELPVRWGALGAQMVGAGVIDREQFEAIYAARLPAGQAGGGLPERERRLLTALDNGNVVMDKNNAGVLLNIFWALGLGNKNRILEEGPMVSPQYGGAGRFASTGGWTLARGDAMEHYSKHAFVTLTDAQQELVERVAKNIYRPCCDNSTYFPDCNHGMAMLGLLEFLASGGTTEEEMYRFALAVNAFWFPDQYATIARYLSSKGISPERANPKEILGKEYSSVSGYQRVASMAPRIEAPQQGGGCGV